MKKTLRFLMWLALASVIGALVIATVGLAWVQAEMPDVVIGLHDGQIVAGDLDAQHWLLAVLGLSAALLTVATVVPLTLAFVFIVVGAALSVALLAVLASLAWVTAPLWIAIALVWWLLRRRKAPRAAAA